MTPRIKVPGNGFRSIVLDCDSTLTAIEGIDELAGQRAAEISALTDAAMDGSIALEEVYGQRLELIRPDRKRVAALGKQYIDRLVKDARDTVAALFWLGKDVRVISGGLLPAVATLASHLGVDSRAVAAVDIHFAADGSFLGFDRDSPLTRNGGKPAIVRSWHLERPILFVGDGATDLEARSVVDLFVAYMGVTYRGQVAEAADVVLLAESLAPVLSLAASPTERDRLRASTWAGLLRRGDDLLSGSR